MKKNTAKSKAAQGCKKISCFFPSLSDKSATPTTLSEIQVLTVTSNEEPDLGTQVLEESMSLLNCKPKRCGSKRKQDAPSNSSPPNKNKKIELEWTLAPEPSTSGSTHSSTLVTSAIVPSTSIGATTPIKCSALISVKTPEKLLTPKALKELMSPVTKKQVSASSSPGLGPKLLHKTPSKHSPKPSSVEKNTPTRTKRTPKKLFEKSPKNLGTFKVEVLTNFVKITPTKREIDNEDMAELERHYLEIQGVNEKTPLKDSTCHISESHKSPTTNVRTKLDFSTARTPSQLKETEKCGNPSEKENCDTINLKSSFEDSWDDDCFVQMDYNLDLSTSQHCKVISIAQRSGEIILTVKSTSSGEQAICSIQGFWMHSKLSIGDIIHLMAAKWDNNWLVNNNAGYVVFEPDLLVNITSVVSSVFCKRRTVFTEKFRGFDPTNKYMIIGSMVHLLLQEVLRCKLNDIKDIEKCALQIFQKPEWVRQIYESGESVSYIAEEFLNYVPKIEHFVSTYVSKQIHSKTYKKDDWKGTISGIEDIEENIWCPDLGIKGKVDVTIKNGLTVMPLEVKTGRASVSVEHRGQVLLYIMMMSKLGYPVSSGLLLYLKEGVLKEIPPSTSEQRDLIMLRNELAYFLSRTPTVVNMNGKCLEPVRVPEPIDHPSCSKCPYSGVCMAYSKHCNEDVSSKKSLTKVFDNLNLFITSVHIDYFMHWVSLLSIEMPQRAGAKELRVIYTVPPEERRTKGKCLINLYIYEVSPDRSGIFLTTFKQQQSETAPDNFVLSGLAENTYVVVSVKTRPAVTTGFVTDVSSDSITLSLDRDLNKKFKDDIFYIDTYDSTTFLHFNMASLSLILDTTKHGNQLRSIIVDRQPATFQSVLRHPSVLAGKAKPIMKRLNRVQQRAVLKAITANEYFLIKGMPGTGKTATIVALIQLLVELKQSVLITSHTHSAVDNVCLKLIKYGVKFIRLGSATKIDPKLRDYSEHELTKNCTSPEAFAAVYEGVQVMAVTCLGSGHAALSKRIMDVCIVDESTQVLQCSIFRALHCSKKFVLIGDPDQLPAVVKNRTAIELGMTESLFERLDSQECRMSLNLNYRMNEPITALANALTYNGELEIGNEGVAKATMKIPNFLPIKKTYGSWVEKALDTKLENAVQFIDTGPVWDKVDNDVTWVPDEQLNEEDKALDNRNIYEAGVIHCLVSALVKTGKVPPRQIGVIATYRVQVALLRGLLKSTEVDVNTVDQFQGKDKNIILYSCSKSKNPNKEWIENKFDLTEDKRRLNVAITRAKNKVIIVGDLETLKKYSTFKKIKNILEKNVLKLFEFPEFNWNDILGPNLSDEGD